MSTMTYTPDEILDMQARRNLIAIHHVARFWVRGCHCRICVCVDRRVPKLIIWRPKDPDRMTIETDRIRPPGGQIGPAKPRLQRA